MKELRLVVFVAALVGTYGFLIKVPTRTVPTQTVPKTAPVGWVHLQKLILPLFENVCEDSTNPIIVRLAQEFEADASSGLYLKPNVIQNFLNLKTGKGFLSKGEIFTEYKLDHKNELKVIYEVLYFAKDFDTFYKAAAWARQNLNCGLFVDALYLSVLKRRDTEKLSIPAPYELLPNYFIRKDVIIKASALLNGAEMTPGEVNIEANAYILDANYTTDIDSNESELKLAYFYEDIGLNSYYFMQKLKQAPWFNTPPNINLDYGEYLYHMMKQLSIRNDLERYANGLMETETIDWDTLSTPNYDPMLIYSNGNEFGTRTAADICEDTDLDFLKNIEANIGTVVTHLKTSGYNKTETLNHLIEVLVTGENSYETVARRLLGKSTIGEETVLAHYLTTLRDPAFWIINKKIVNIIDKSLQNVPGYSRNELIFPGVEILNVEIKKMATLFDRFLIDVTDALKVEEHNSTFQVKIAQSRLNHKSFTVKLNISSLVTQKGLLKIYLGPKVAPGTHSLKKNLFMLLDSFEVNLKVGSNVISRSSGEMINLSEDFTLLKVLRKNIEDAEFGLNALPLKSLETVTGFPSRLILPKGTEEGLPLQVFVFIAPFVKATLSGLYSVINADFNTAILSPGYPLDLDISVTQIFGLPNAMVKDFIVTHKGDSKGSNYGGSGKKWEGGKSYDPSSRPDYSLKGKETFDYSSKKGQYGKKDDIPNVSDDSSSSSSTNGKTDDIPNVSDGYKNVNIDNVITNTDKNENINVLYENKDIEEIYDNQKDHNVDMITSDIEEQPRLLQSKWPNDGSSKPDYSSKRKQFDYESKKDLYRKKQEARKRGDYNYVEEKSVNNKIIENEKRNGINLENELVDANESNKAQNSKKEDVYSVSEGYDKVNVEDDIVSQVNAENIYDNYYHNLNVSDTGEQLRLLQSRWPSDDSARPDYSSKRKQPFDYKSKKDQYRKKQDYERKRGDFNKYAADKAVNNEVIENGKTNDEINHENEPVEENQLHQNYPFTIPTTKRDDDVGILISDENNDDDKEASLIINNDLRKYRDMLLRLSEKRVRSVFDYLFPSRIYDDDDSEDSKIYE